RLRAQNRGSDRRGTTADRSGLREVAESDEPRQSGQRCVLVRKTARQAARWSIAVSPLEIYDKAKYHYEGEFPADLDDDQAYVHTGFFLGWLVEHNFLADEIVRDFEKEIAAFNARRTTAPQLYALLGGVFDETMLTDEGNRFTRAYFDLEKG